MSVVQFKSKNAAFGSVDAGRHDAKSVTDDVRIGKVVDMCSPEELLRELQAGANDAELVLRSRGEIRDILHDKDDRLVVVVGPCSIHDPRAGLEYAGLLAQARKQWSEDLLLVMRVYFEKPRTVVGWKGLINDPYIDNSFSINDGLRIARRFLLDIAGLEVPSAVEFLDLITPQYLADVVSWGAIGARTTESQGHRELGSGLSCPLGFKNGTGGNIQIAADAVGASRQPHHFISVKKDGRAAVFQTRGNKDSHIILRGGSSEPNYDAASVGRACEILKASGLDEKLMIDFSHANSHKDHRNQPRVAEDVAGQIATGDARIFGVMIESHLVEGRQEYSVGGSNVYGQSITDACVSWDTTEQMFDTLASAVRARRASNRT
ncbi:MAG: 3-deoxy-7-phosphoheptulonate synthase [Proteobacteria bacterium]|nr:3-deoxy-7-phosphoheptulonate synthase [Pseudomonadota bacterium]